MRSWPETREKAPDANHRTATASRTLAAAAIALFFSSSSSRSPAALLPIPVRGLRRDRAQLCHQLATLGINIAVVAQSALGGLRLRRLYMTEPGIRRATFHIACVIAALAESAMDIRLDPLAAVIIIVSSACRLDIARDATKILSDAPVISRRRRKSRERADGSGCHHIRSRGSETTSFSTHVG